MPLQLASLLGSQVSLEAGAAPVQVAHAELFLSDARTHDWLPGLQGPSWDVVQAWLFPGVQAHDDSALSIVPLQSLSSADVQSRVVA